MSIFNFRSYTIRKIPQSVLAKCEYGADNYNLNIIEVPELDEADYDDMEEDDDGAES